MRLPAAKVAPLLFCSGLCALVYQSAWLRELRLVFGASTAASAAVLAIFMGGLGAGGLLLGKRADAHRDPFTLYGYLEIGVSLFAAITPPLVGVVRWLYGRLGGSVVMGLGLGTVVRLVLAALVLLPPTLLMGGTLPAAAKAVESEDDAGRRNLALLYGANTLGAVTGAAASTFVLLEVFGADRMLWIACVLNALVGAIALVVTHRATDDGMAAAAPRLEASGASPEESAVPPRFVLAASAIVGFAFLLMELVWYRMLAPILGGSSYTFGLILVLALLGVGLGGAAYGVWMERRPATLAGLALTCALEALCLAVPFALGDRLALGALAVRDLGALGFGSLVFGWSLIAAIVVLPAAFVSGVQFPLLIALLGRGSRGVGAHVGLAYAWNTVGAIVGSLAGGFGLLPIFTAPGVWRGVVILLGVLGVVAAWLAHRSELSTSRGAAIRLGSSIAAAIVAVLLLRTAGPTAVWRHAGIGAGRASLALRSSAPNEVEEWNRNQRRTIHWEADGVESSVAVSAGEGVAFVVNGKVDGHAVVDGGTQIMSGLLGALVVPDARRVLVIGLGTGSTAGWLGAVPSIERVDVVELEPAILRVARDAAAVNQRVLDNPRVHVTIGDAREVLLTSRQRYDVVFSEPSNPYRAGIASLFTREFYVAAAERIAPGGVFLQWLQAYEVDGQTVRTAIATLASVFPSVEIWVTEAGDLVLMASHEPRVHDAERLRARIAEEPFKSALEKAWRVSDLEGVFAHYLAAPGLARAIANQEGRALNTDDRNLLEFGFARNVGRDTGFTDLDLWSVAHTRREDRPAVRGPVDWERVEAERRAFDVIVARPPRATTGSPALVKRVEAYTAYASRDFASVLAAFRGRPPPSGSFELEIVAESLAETGSDEAVPLLDRLREHEPTEADALLARLRFRQGRTADAAAALEAALRGYRTDPWAKLDVMRRVVTEVSLDLGRDPALGRRAYAALEQPFAASMLEDERREARVKLAARLDFRGLCVDALAALEPHMPFRREILSLRRECYAAVHSPLLARAERDLADLVARESPVFNAGLIPEPSAR
ncbi:Spermidine synthase [Minicystis rosea]|nr:Spermidine synthase [Minicystis rosea]